MDDEATFAFYARSMKALDDAGVPFLVGGAYAFERSTGIARHTKDFDVFVRPADLDEAFDDVWFEHAVDDTVLGVRVQLMPAEEMIWSKGFIMERERYDGADIAHLLHARAECLDWGRLLARYGRHWRVLFSHLVLFGFIYPSDRGRIPAWVMQDLTRRLHRETATVPVRETTPVCRGPLLSRAQYLHDIEQRGVRDARLTHESAMNEEDVQLWTDGIKVDGERPAA